MTTIKSGGSFLNSEFMGQKGLNYKMWKNLKFLKKSYKQQEQMKVKHNSLSFLCVFAFEIDKCQWMAGKGLTTPFLLCREEKRSVAGFLSVSLHAYQKPTKKISCVKMEKAENGNLLVIIV